MEKRNSAFFAFLVGGAIGAGIALLFAPYEGRATRRKIKEGIGDAGDWAKDRFNDAKYRVGESTGRVKQIISEKKEDIQAAFEAGKEAYHKGKERLARETGA